MSDFRDSARFARLVTTFVERANERGWPIDGAHAAVLLGDRITRVAAMTRRAESAVVRDYQARDVIAFVDASARAHLDASEIAPADDRPAVVPGQLFAGLTACLAWVIQVAAHNGDLDTVNMAADALRNLGWAFEAVQAEANVPAHALHLAQRAVLRARRGIGSGWRLRLDEGPTRVRELLGGIDETLQDREAEIAAILKTVT